MNFKPRFTIFIVKSSSSWGWVISWLVAGGTQTLSPLPPSFWGNKCNEIWKPLSSLAITKILSHLFSPHINVTEKLTFNFYSFQYSQSKELLDLAEQIIFQYCQSYIWICFSSLNCSLKNSNIEWSCVCICLYREIYLWFHWCRDLWIIQEIFFLKKSSLFHRHLFSASFVLAIMLNASTSLIHLHVEFWGKCLSRVRQFWPVVG